MFDGIDLGKILFFDIETASAEATYEELDEAFRDLWREKSTRLMRRQEDPPTEEEVADFYRERAAIYAEFGRIICISVGIIHRTQDKRLGLRLKSFAAEDEGELLREFVAMVEEYYENPHNRYFCGHNIREFDIPYICRRMMVHRIPYPRSLQLAGKRPWEAKHLLDTMEYWKFGDYKSYTSLKLLAALLGFPSPKDDIDGSEVGRVFWEENDLERIARYCERDVLATVQLVLRYRHLPLLEEEQVEVISG
ncbi:MAG: 3'-5' exonuclease [Saprospiraceae bacterium]|nr:3'-5' exonuclease [Saprospiraceae bacterium]